jgi:hypothetical protein
MGSWPFAYPTTSGQGPIAASSCCAMTSISAARIVSPAPIKSAYAAHKHPAVKAWLTANPRIVCHFTRPASWMDLVEIWFSLIERQAIRGTFASVGDLNAKIRGYIDGWNGRCQPFVWTKPLTRSSRKPTVKRTQTRGTSASKR